MLADEQIKNSSLSEQKELVEVWHSDSRKQIKSRKSATSSTTPTSRPGTSNTVQEDGAANLDEGGEWSHGAGAVKLVPYSGPRAAEMEKIRDAFFKVRTHLSACL